MKMASIEKRRLIASIFCSLLFLPTISLANDNSIFGTIRTQFRKVYAGGKHTGCEIEYLTIAKDDAYRSGLPVAVNGSIFLNSHEETGETLLALKVGLKDFSSTRNTDVEAPNFAYLRTSNASTVDSPPISFIDERGYKNFVLNASDQTTRNLLQGLISSKQAEIGFNRFRDGMDVIATLDLTVSESRFSNGRKAVRIRSNKVLDDFAECVKFIADVE